MEILEGWQASSPRNTPINGGSQPVLNECDAKTSRITSKSTLKVHTGGAAVSAECISFDMATSELHARMSKCQDRESTPPNDWLLQAKHLLQMPAPVR